MMITYTAQEAYDKICAHLAKQKTRAMDVTGTCRYRTVDLTKACAVGCLIPDEDYTTDLEGGAVDCLSRVYPIQQVINDREEGWTLGFLNDMQRAHDLANGAEPEALRLKLAKIATSSGLIAGAEQAITEWDGRMTQPC